MIIFRILIFLIFPIFIYLFKTDIYSIMGNFEKDLNSFNMHKDWISMCLTTGSILFAIQSFLIPFMQKSLYDTQTYIDYLKATYKNWQKEHYRPLKNLSDFLFIAILSAFISIILTAITMFVNNLGILLISFYFGIISFADLIIALFVMRINFNIMFTYNKNNNKA